ARLAVLLDRAVDLLVVRPARHVGELARRQRQTGRGEPDVIGRALVVAVELLEAPAVIADVGGAHDRVRDDLLLEGEVPVLYARVGLVVRKVAREDRAPGQARGVFERDDVTAVAARDDRRYGAHTVVSDAVGRERGIRHARAEARRERRVRAHARRPGPRRDREVRCAVAAAEHERAATLERAVGEPDPRAEVRRVA